MFQSMSFAVSSILYVIIITCVYFWKRKVDEGRNLAPFFFRFLLFYTSFLFLIEIGCVITIYYKDVIPVFNEWLCRMHILGDIVWITIFLVYIWCSTKKPVTDIERVKQRRYVTITLLIVDVVIYYFTLDLNVTYSTAINPSIYIVGGTAMYPVYFFGVFFIFVLLFYVIKMRSRVAKSLRLSLYYFAIIYTLFAIIQLVYFDYRITYVMSMFCFGVVGLFFTLESQDTKLLNDVEKSKKEAEVANKAKTEFLSNVSHQIRTPMNTILGFSQALLDEKDLSETLVKKDAASIKAASNNLLELINNILDISRIESGKENIEEKDYKLSDILFEINSVISSKINKDVVNFQINVDENIPSGYYGDSNKLYSVLIRVLLNSLEHTKFGSVTLDVGGAFDGDVCKLSLLISNTGHEMKYEDFEKEFEDFANIEDHANDMINSTKLGLIVAKSLIKMMDGTIDFKNEKGKGTRYIISIDQKVIDDSKIGKIFASDGGASRHSFIDCSGKSVLIVDDNNLNLKLTSRLLEQYKFNITCVDNGADCIDSVKDIKYDIIFLDHMMPNMDGMVVVHNLRDNGYKSPIIALTANSYTGLRETYIKEGFDDYLAKPINKKDLDKIIREFFGDRGGEE